MKSIIAILAAAAVVSLSGCYYAEKSVTKPLHAVGHGVEKSGHVVHRVGTNIQAATE